MWIGASVQRDILGLAEQGVELFEPLVGLRAATGVEVILFLRHDDHGLRCHGGEKVAMIEIECQNSWRALLVVLWQFVLGITAKGGHEARWRAHRETRLQTAQPRRLGAAAGISRHADVPLVDLRPREQVVERSNGIPREPRAEKLAHEQHGIAHLIVLRCAAAEARTEFLIQILKSLALACGIDQKTRHALPCETLRKALIRLRRLAIERVAAHADHAWHLAWCVRR